MVNNFNNKNVQLLNNVQYFLSSVIAVCFGIGLIPTLYDNVVNVIMVALGFQIIISLFRGRLLNVFFEIFLIGLGALAYIPLLGYFFRFLGIIFSILEIASFKNTFLYKQMEIRTFRMNQKSRGSSSKSKSKVSGKATPKFKDAEFTEKKNKSKK